MEYGGTFLNKRLHRSNKEGNYRRTSDAFQLALATVYQSPAQNFALAPNNLEDASPIALDYMREVPTKWEETKYVAGYPGKYAVIARKSGGKWYIAGINAEKDVLSLDLDLSFVSPGEAVLYADGENDTLIKKEISLKNKKKEGVKFNISVPSESGFVIVK